MRKLSQFAIVLSMMASLAPAWGKTVKESPLPVDARLLEQLKATSWDGRKNLIIAGDASIISFEKDKISELEVTCRELIYVWIFEATCDGLISCIIPGGYAKTGLTINAYCAPRSMSQKFMQSLLKTCEANPTEECIKLAPQLDQIQPTITRNIGRP